MFNVIATVTVKPECIDEFEAAVAAARPAFLADEGCLRYDLQRVVKSEGDFVFIEAYDSKDALRRHGSMAEFAAMGEATQALVESRPVVTVMTPVGDQVDLGASSRA